MAIEILTPPGRIVWGHPIEKDVKTDPKTRKPVLGKDGKEQDVWAFGLAIPKDQFAPVEQAIAQAAYQMYPQGNFPRDFSWKIKRETDLDENNKPYGEREGYAGCVVLTISTQAFCPPLFKFENGSYRQLEAKEIKCGDWIASKLSIAAHPGGVYINPMCHDFVGYGAEIQRRSAANPNETFGGRTYQLPPGVTTTPQGGGAASGVAMPSGVPQNIAAPQPAAIPGGYQQTMPQAYGVPQNFTAPMQPHQAVMNQQPPQMPVPAHDFVQNAGVPSQPQQYTPPAPTAAPMPQAYAAPQPAVGHGVPGQQMPGIPQGR